MFAMTNFNERLENLKESHKKLVEKKNSVDKN